MGSQKRGHFQLKKKSEGVPKADQLCTHKDDAGEGSGIEDGQL